MCLNLWVIFRQFQTLLRTAVKSCITGQRNRYIFIFRIFFDIRNDLIRAVCFIYGLSDFCHCLDHPACSDQKFCFLTASFCFQCNLVSGTCTDSHQCNFPVIIQFQFFLKEFGHFFKIHSLFFFRPSDHNHFHTGF